jgi:hypothetical protein
MLENLLQLVKENAGAAIVNNPVIPNERNDEAIEFASSSIVDTLKNAASNGNFGDIMSMFNGGGNAADSPMANVMNNDLVKGLMDKFNLNQGDAGGVANGLLPNIINQFVSKTNDPNDSSFDIQGILGKLTGGGSGGFDVQNIISQFTGAGGNNAGGGILDNLKGLFGK